MSIKEKVLSVLTTREESVTINLSIGSIRKIANKNWFAYLLLIPVLLIGYYARTRNLGILQGKYLLGLDPYFFFRQSQYILEHGTHLVHDAMRYVPVGTTNTANGLFLSYILAWTYKLFGIPIGMTQLEWHIIYPVIAGVIAFFFFFLFARELFGNNVALVSTAFLVTIPAFIYRTGAGFADHEALAVIFWFASMWLFARAWNTQNRKLALGYAATSGFLGFLMSISWGGFNFLLVTIGLFLFASIFFTTVNKTKLFAAISWIAVFNIFRMSVVRPTSFLEVQNLILVAGAAALLIYLYLPKLLSLVKQEKLLEKIPPAVFSVSIILVLAVIANLLLGLIDLSALLTNIINPQGIARLSTTISENQQPFVMGGGSNWIGSMGWLFFLAFFGSIYTFYTLFANNKKTAVMLGGVYLLSFTAIIFGRFSPVPKYATAVSFFSQTYFYWFFGFLIAVLGIYWYIFKNDKSTFESLSHENWQILLAFVFFVFMAIMARGSVRIIFAFAPAIALIAGYFVVNLTTTFLKIKRTRILAAILIILAAFTFYANFQSAAAISASSGSGYPGQWEDAYTWMREATPEDSVIAHWWDYGYWTQTMGERASVVDGGNQMGWDHGMGRYGLLGRDPQNYLPYLKTHNVTHLLISEEELPKFRAFAFIGSDETLDLESTIGVFSLQQQQEVRNGTRLIYGGVWPLDKDYVIGSKVLPKNQAAIIGFSIMMTEQTLSEPSALLIYNGQQLLQPVSCVVLDGQRVIMNDPADSLNGCMAIQPAFSASGQANPFGTVFWASEKVKDTNLVRLYIFGEEIPYFEEVYSDPTPLGSFASRVIGPIKIWEVKYPDWVQTDEKYLESSLYG